MNPIEIQTHYRQQKALYHEGVLVPQTTILYRSAEAVDRLSRTKKLGIAMILFCFGAFLAAATPFLQLDSRYMVDQIQASIIERLNSMKQQARVLTNAPQPRPELNPLVAPDGSPIVPVNTDFSIIVPKLGINATVIPGVNPSQKFGYQELLKKGVAHASTSFYPNENGTVYLFSHSTNYEWFVDDLNAVFYLLKNAEPGDYVVLMYIGDRYTYQIREKKIVSSREVAYLQPQSGTRTLILQTCYPPGTFYKRLLVFADLIETKENVQFSDIQI